jgi:plastin-1
MEGVPHLVLGLIWQVVKIGLFRKINLTSHPGLVRLLEEGETLQDLLKLPPDQILLRWMNYHLKAAGHARRVKNFSGDIRDAECYTVILNQISAGKCSKDPLNTADTTKRAEQMLTQAEKIKCRKYVKARDVVKGNAKLNLAFVAHMFNTCPALDPPEEPIAEIIEETREEKAYRTWLNHFGFDPTVNWLYEDLRDGLILLKVMDKISPGIVDWKKVNQTYPIAPFKKIENCNYAILCGKQLKFSLVGIAGKDITDGNKTLTLALVWQMMRFHCVSIVKALGANASDQDVLNACNARIKAANKTHTAGSFKDASIATGHYAIDLVAATDAGAVNYDVVGAGATDDDKLANARYAITVARKVGAVVFLLPEDIVECKPKMLLTYSAAVLAVDPK